jgi:hypothetical protein
MPKRNSYAMTELGEHSLLLVWILLVSRYAAKSLDDCSSEAFTSGKVIVIH